MNSIPANKRAICIWFFTAQEIDSMKNILLNVDCIELYVPDLDEGMRYYCGAMGLKLLWRADTSAGLGMEGDITEVVLQTDRKRMNVDFKVESVADAVEKIREAGGKVLHGPFDIPIGKCAVVRDRWENEYVILDMTKGRYVTDENGNVVGVSK
jgi:lactoylglutathione lyase